SLRRAAGRISARPAVGGLRLEPPRPRVTAVRVGIAVDDVAVLRLRDQLQGRHRMELLRSLRRVGWLRREPGRYEEVSRVPRLVPAHRGTANHRECRRISRCALRTVGLSSPTPGLYRTTRFGTGRR